MSFIAPVWLAVAGLVGAGVLFAHLFATTIPPQDVFPTAAFIPQSKPEVVVRSRRLSDVLLLLLRLVAVLLLGLAFAGAHVRRSAPDRIVLADVSRAVGSAQAVKDSVSAAAKGHVRLIAFDSVAREARAETLATITTSHTRGSLSGALVAAHRTLVGASDGSDRAELVVVSPLVREEVDSATQELLSRWPGPVRFVRVPVATDAAHGSWEIRAEGDDPVRASLTGVRSASGPATARIVRTSPARADSAWASAGGALVVWPTNAAPAMLPVRARPDSQGAIATETAVTVAAFERRFDPHPGTTLVRWGDGAPAATERALGKGCIRDVAIPVDGVGDVALRESFRTIAAGLLQPCGGAPDFRAAELEAPRRVAAAAVVPTDAGSLPMWLALIALAVLVTEQVLRARRSVA